MCATRKPRKNGYVHHVLCGLSCFFNVVFFRGRYWETTSSACGQFLKERGGSIEDPFGWPNLAWWVVWKVTEVTDEDHTIEAHDRELEEQIYRLRRNGYSVEKL